MIGNYTVALPGDKRRSKLDSLQLTIARLMAEQARIASSPVHVDEVRDRIQAQLGAFSAVAIAARNMFSPLLVDKGLAGLPPDVPLSLRDLAWIFGAKDIATRICDASLTELTSTAKGLKSHERAEKLAPIEAELEKLQVEEERQILELFDAGVMAARRNDADPRLLIAEWQKEETNVSR